MFPIHIMHNLKKKHNEAVTPDNLVEFHEPYCEDIREFWETIAAMIRAVLNTIVMCPVHVLAEQRISIFYYCEKVISMLRT